MTERDIIKIVDNEPYTVTDFSSPYWDDVSFLALESCFNKGFLRWRGEKLIVTPLGRRSCGGKNERHN